MLSVELVFVHGQRRTTPISPIVGLKEGCSLSPLVFRWCIEEAGAEAQEDWNWLDHGRALDDWVLQVLAWADDLLYFRREQAASRRDDCHH